MLEITASSRLLVFCLLQVAFALRSHIQPLCSGAETLGVWGGTAMSLKSQSSMWLNICGGRLPAPGFVILGALGNSLEDNRLSNE